MAITAVWDDFYDAATDVTDAIEDAGAAIVDAVSDAGDVIGAVFKTIAPFVAMIPGFGTVLSIALSTAAALALGDPLDQALIDIATNAIPAGAPRVSFSAAADITRASLNGEPLGPVAIRSMRNVASSVGGQRAVAAFEQGLAVARGEKLGDATWRLAREAAAQGGPAVLAAFDAGVAAKNGEGVEGAVYAAARSYLESAGGNVALAAFDTGIALARGQALQDAGFAGLKSFVAGNDAAERAIAYGEAMAKAAREGRSVGAVLLEGLLSDVGKLGASAVAAELGPVLSRWSTNWGTMGSFALAAALGISEPVARAAQAIMRDGEPDLALLARMPKTGVQSAVEKYGADVVASRETNSTWVDTRAQLREEQLMLVARMSDDALSFRRAVAEQAPAVSVPYVAPVLVPVRQILPPPLVQAARPVERSSVAADLALGGVIAGAAVALVWWARSR